MIEIIIKSLEKLGIKMKEKFIKIKNIILYIYKD